jgi:hypothetical protein
MKLSVTRWERAALIMIVLIGVGLRFQHLGEIEYNVDQVYPVWQAIRTLDAGDFPLAGQGTSVLFANPPLTGYLFTPLIALVRLPLAAVGLTLVLNSLAIWLAYRALRGLIGVRPALVGAALFAVNPWIIEDSRRTWVQSLAPFFVCMIFWALAPLLTHQTRHPQRRLLIALVGFALFAHTYLLAYALAVPLLVLIVVFWRRIPKRPLIIAGAVFALMMVLYGIGLARQWDDTTRRAGDFSSGQARLSSEALNHALGLVTGRGYAEVRGVRAPADDAEIRGDLSDAAHLIWTMLIVVGIGRMVYRLAAAHRRQRRIVADVGSKTGQASLPDSVGAGLALPVVDNPKSAPITIQLSQPGGEALGSAAIMLLVWAALPVLMMSYVSRVVHPFYLLLSVPAWHGFAAWGIEPLLRRRSLLPLALILVIFTGAINGLNTVRFAQNTAAFPGEDLPETLPLAQALALGSRIKAERAPGMAVLSPMPEWTPVTLAGHAIRTEELSGFERAILLPPDGALYLTFEVDPTPPLYSTRAGSPLVLADGTRIHLWRVLPRDLVIDHPAEIPSDIGVSFVGWTLNGDLRPGQAVQLDTFWQVDALDRDRGIWAFAPYAHLFGADGARLLIADGVTSSALDWRVGDRLVERLTFTVPADSVGPYAVHVGLFDSVRARPDGTPGIDAIFRIPAGDEVVYAASIEIIRAAESG